MDWLFDDISDDDPEKGSSDDPPSLILQGVGGVKMAVYILPAPMPVTVQPMFLNIFG